MISASVLEAGSRIVQSNKLVLGGKVEHQKAQGS